MNAPQPGSGGLPAQGGRDDLQPTTDHGATGPGLGRRIVFAGTPEFALVALKALHQAGFDIPLVLTQPDRPGGRGMRLQASPVKAYALQHGLPLMQPPGLGAKYADEAGQLREAIIRIAPDLLVVAAYGLLLPAWLLELPRWGCMNIHASLLPRWRGAAPIHRAIEAGDAQSGVCIMQMDVGLDTGDILIAQPVAIAADETAGSLLDKLADLGARLMIEALQLRAQERLPRTAQPSQGVSYARKIEKHEALIDWKSPAALIERRVRAFNPFPGCATQLGQESIKVWGAALAEQELAPGTPAGTILRVEDDAIVVAAADGALLLTQLQRAGGKRLATAEFLRGFPITAGSVLGLVG